MPSLNINDQGQTPRPDLTIFYVLDRSGSMSGARDAILDVAMEDTIRELKKIRSTDSHLRIAVLEYDSSVRWLTPFPEYIEDFVWRGIAKNRTEKGVGQLSSPGGLTNIPAALNELNAKMSKSEFLDLKMGSYMPIVIFMTDGYINDQFVSQLQPALSSLNDNLWFKRSTKIGFAIGDDSDRDVVVKIVGEEGFNDTKDLQAFADKLVRVSVTASIINGSSRVVVDADAEGGWDDYGVLVNNEAADDQGTSEFSWGDDGDVGGGWWPDSFGVSTSDPDNGGFTGGW